MTDNPPIVDVPISGGVEYGTNSNDWTSQVPANLSDTNWSDYQWFDPLGFYCAQPSVTQADCYFWCEQCGGQLVPTLMNKNTLQGTAPNYPPFTPPYIAALGICQIFWLQVFSAWWSSVTGNSESNGGGSQPGGGGG